MRIFYFNITYRCNSNCMFCAADHPLLHENDEMSLEDFEHILSDNHVGENDRVIVNGGEPTIHKDFLSILDAIDRRGATIDLFTNGITLAQKDFTDQILKHRNLYIRIPLFGSDAKSHDLLTGRSGNFKAVTEGLDYLVGHLRDDVLLEIKLLLSKSTVQDNEKIYELIRKRWNRKSVILSLNPLLISQCVIQNKDLFIDTYEHMLEQSASLIAKIHNDGQNFTMALIPFCAFPSKELMELCHGNTIMKESHYTDPSKDLVIDEFSERSACLHCKYISICNGYPNSYIKYFGQKVMKPF